MYQTASLNSQVPIHVSILGNVSTRKAPSSASVVGVMLAHVVKLTSMNVCPCPARMMPLASTGSESLLASACQVLRPVELYGEQHNSKHIGTSCESLSPQVPKYLKVFMY